LNGTDGTDPEQIFLEECSMLILLLQRHKALLNRWDTFYTPIPTMGGTHR
jgi:hypothetical protein